MIAILKRMDWLGPSMTLVAVAMSLRPYAFPWVTIFCAACSGFALGIAFQRARSHGQSS